jgi:Tfp pilus assembly protein FimT
MNDRRSEAGVTLIELMLAVMLLGIIIVPLTSAMITGLITTGEARARLSESRSPLFTSAFFADDAQSSDVNGISVGPTPACGSGTNVVSFTWTEDTTQYQASYVTTTTNGTPVLKRNFCSGGAPDVSTLAPVLTDPAVTPPTVTCTDAAGTVVSCAVGTSAIRRIELDATTPNRENDPFFKMIATRRAT